MSALLQLFSVAIALQAVLAIPPEWPPNIYFADDTEYFLLEHTAWKEVDAKSHDILALAKTALFELEKQDGAKKDYRLQKIQSSYIKIGDKGEYGELLPTPNGVTIEESTPTPSPTSEYLLSLSYEQSKCQKSTPKFFDPVVCPRAYEEAHWPLDHVAYVTVTVIVNSQTKAVSLDMAFSRRLDK